MKANRFLHGGLEILFREQSGSSRARVTERGRPFAVRIAKSDKLLREVANASSVSACVALGYEAFELRAFGLPPCDKVELPSGDRSHIVEPALG